MGQGYEILHTQALGAETEDWVGQEIRSDQRLEGIAKGLAALAEGGLHYRAEKLFIATEGCAGIAGQADHGGLDLRCPVFPFRIPGLLLSGRRSR